jgi:hypothetical protein
MISSEAPSGSSSISAKNALGVMPSPWHSRTRLVIVTSVMPRWLRETDSGARPELRRSWTHDGVHVTADEGAVQAPALAGLQEGGAAAHQLA